MVQVINLGKFDREPDRLGLISNALARGIEVGQRNKELKSREKFVQQELEFKKSDEKRKREAAQRDAASHELKMEKEGLEFGEAVQEKLSKMAISNPNQYEMFLQTDGGKDLVKQLKSYAPMLVGDDGKPRLLSQEQLLEKNVSDIKERLRQKVAAGIPLEKEEQGLFDVIEKQGEERVARLFSDILSNMPLDLGPNPSPEEQRNYIQSQLSGFKEFRSQLSEGLAGGSGDKISGDDPLGVFK